MVFLADRLRREADRGWQPLVLMGSELPFPFELAPARPSGHALPDGASHGLALLEGWGVPSRLTSLQGYEGCHNGYVTDLAAGAWRVSSPGGPTCRSPSSPSFAG